MNPNPSGSEMWNRASNDKTRVKTILQTVPGTRGDDRLLHFWVCLRFYGVNILRDKLSFAQFRALPAQETLARRRREIQETNEELRPAERTLKKRARRENQYIQHYAGTTTLMEWEQ